MKFLQIILIVVIFFFMIFVLVMGTETEEVLSMKKERLEEAKVICFANEDTVRVERARCSILLQQLRIKTEPECDCSEEIEDVENMYREYLQNLEETCYYNYNNYLGWELQ